MIRENATKRKLLSGGTVFGIFMPFPAPGLIELCGIAGFDFVIIDMEHGPIDVVCSEDLMRAAEVAGVTPIVRVASTEPTTILRYLDIGAQGIMVPHVNSKEDAERAVSAVRYPPLGKRGMGSWRAAAYGQRIHRREWVRHANQETLLIAMLEEITAVSNLQNILSVDGVDAYEIGPGDLSLSLAVPGETSHPKVQAAVDAIVDAVLAAGRIVSDTANDVETARRFLEKGYRMMNCSFVNVATSALRNMVSGMRAAAAPASR